MKKRFLMVFGLLGFIGCDKSDDAIDGGDRFNALLGQWDIREIMAERAVDLNDDGIASIDLMDSQEIRQCFKDNVTTYRENGPSGRPEYSVTDNTLTCDDDPMFGFVEQDNWRLSEDNNSIIFDERDPFRIQFISKNKLIVETDDLDLLGATFIMTLTYEKR